MSKIPTISLSVLTAAERLLEKADREALESLCQTVIEDFGYHGLGCGVVSCQECTMKPFDSTVRFGKGTCLLAEIFSTACSYNNIFTLTGRPPERKDAQQYLSHMLSLCTQLKAQV